MSNQLSLDVSSTYRCRRWFSIFYQMRSSYFLVDKVIFSMFFNFSRPLSNVYRTHPSSLRTTREHPSRLRTLRDYWLSLAEKSMAIWIEMRNRQMKGAESAQAAQWAPHMIREALRKPPPPWRIGNVATLWWTSPSGAELMSRSARRDSQRAESCRSASWRTRCGETLRRTWFARGSAQNLRSNHRHWGSGSHWRRWRRSWKRCSCFVHQDEMYASAPIGDPSMRRPCSSGLSSLGPRRCSLIAKFWLNI